MIKSCKTCVYFDKIVDANNINQPRGHCMYNPPVLYPLGVNNAGQPIIISELPQTMQSRKCHLHENAPQ